MAGEHVIDRPSRDEVHALLASEGRRSILQYLAADGGSAPVPAIARHLAAEVDGVPVTERDAQVRLRHVDLPRFAEAGIVSMDQDRHRVMLTPTGEWLDRIRRRIEAAFEAESV